MRRAARRKRRNPSGGWSSFAQTVVAGVATSLLTILVLEAMRKAREATARPAQIAPGHGTA